MIRPVLFRKRKTFPLPVEKPLLYAEKGIKNGKKNKKQASFLSIPIDLYKYLLYNTIYKISTVFSQTNILCHTEYMRGDKQMQDEKEKLDELEEFSLTGGAEEQTDAHRND